MCRRENPTAYRYGYLWAVHSLYYWWRDQGIAEEGSIHPSSPSDGEGQRSPCYLNRMDVTEIAVGWGRTTLELLRSLLLRYGGILRGLLGHGPLELANCLSPPAREYRFPRDLYHHVD